MENSACFKVLRFGDGYDDHPPRCSLSDDGGTLHRKGIVQFLPVLASGAPLSPERQALIKAFQEKSVDLDKSYEARTFKKDWTMPYRLFRPTKTAKAALVLYLHGSGGLGDDNEKQLALGNIYGTRVWLLPENQKRFPCFVVAPQTDRAWARYKFSADGKNAQLIEGLGEGSSMAMEIVQQLCREFPIDKQRLYVTGQSMGGAGVWNMIAHGPRMFAAAIPCCGSETLDDLKKCTTTPIWNFHGDADESVPVEVSRERMKSLRAAGGQPIYTEYAGVGHNVWQWAYTEPALIDWMLAQRR